MSPENPGQRHDARFVLWLSLAQLISWGSVFYLFAVLLEPVERDLGMSRAQSSMAFGVALLAEGLLAYPVGRWIDRGHERAVMGIGSLTLAAGLLALSAAPDATAFVAAWGMLGAGLAATLYNPAFAVLTRRFPHDFRRAIISLTFLGGLASTVFIPLCFWLIDVLGWRQALWVLAGLHALVCAPLHAWLLRGAPAQTIVAAAASAQAAARPDAAPGQRADAASPSLGQQLRSTPFVLIGIFMVLMMAVVTAIPAHLVPLLREAGLGPAWVIAIPAAVGLLQVAGRALLFLVEHRLDVHRANRWIPALVPLGLAALLASSGQGLGAFVFVALYGMGNGMLTIVKGTAIALYVGRTHVAALNGALGLPTALARAAAPMAVGLLWSPSRGYALGLWMLLAMGVAGVLALALAQRAAASTAP